MKATRQQQKAEHVYFRQVAESLNDAGYTLGKGLEKMDIKEIEIPWTEENVKEIIWRVIQDGMFNKESTTELESGEVNQIYLVVDHFLTDRFGIESIDFPQVEPNYSDCRENTLT